MKKSELIKKLRAFGCFYVEDLTRHESWYSPITKMFFTIPRHSARDIPNGTLRSIKKQSGVNF